MGDDAMGTNLYIKWSFASPNDDGTRPLIPCGPPNYYWTNQSIWLSAVDDPATLKNVATESEEIQINVRVTNKSKAPTFTPDAVNALFVTAQVWVCNYAVGVGPGAGAIASGGGASGQPSPITVAIPGGGTGLGHVKWTPAPGDLNINTTAAGEGHVCLAANVYWEGSAPPAESHAYPPPASLALCGDGLQSLGGHHGQRNILIAPAKAGGGMKIQANVFNPGRTRETFRIDVDEASPPKMLRGAEREALLAEKFVELVGGKRLPVRLRKVDGVAAEPRERARLRNGGTLVLEDSERPIRAARKPIEELMLRARGAKGERIEVTPPPRRGRLIDLEFDMPNEAPGTVHAFDLFQRNRRGNLLGGARILAVITE